MIWVFYLLFCWACVFYWDDYIGWNVRYAMKWNCRKPKKTKQNRSKSLLFYSCYFLGACCRALPAGLFTHFKFWACFHQHTGWKTFAPPLERSQMWWKIQVADIHLMHYAFHVLSRVTVGRVWHYWNNKRKKKKLTQTSMKRNLHVWVGSQQIWKEKLQKLLKLCVWMLISHQTSAR